MKRIAVAAVLALTIAPAAQARSFFEDMARRTAENLAAKAAAAVQDKVVSAVTNPGAGAGSGGDQAAPTEEEAPAVMRPRARSADQRTDSQTSAPDSVQPDHNPAQEQSPSR